MEDIATMYLAAGGFNVRVVCRSSQRRINSHLSSVDELKLSPESLQPPLKWAGGKRWLIPRLTGIWSGHSGLRLVEPFCGGLSIALGLRPCRALLNDKNHHLINFYRWLQRGLLVSGDMANDQATYYRNREAFNALQTSGHSGSAEAAGLFYYLNKTGYNGLCRLNKQGHFNVPFGRYSSRNYRRDFREYKDLLSHWDFRSSDFEDLKLGADDFVYADPPYDVEFTRYGTSTFTWSDHVRLATWLKQHRGPVLVSNEATDRIVTLYRDLGFHIQKLSAPRSISSDGSRGRANEILASRGVTL